MRTALPILCASVVLLGFSCTTSTTRTSLPQAPNPFYTTTAQGKKIAWCDTSNRDTSSSTNVQDSDLWISAEMFSGMTHEPTIYHICWTNIERFAVHMGDKQPDGSRTGYFILPDQPQAFVFGIASADPIISIPHTGLRQATDPIHIVIDGKQFVYNPTSQTFFESK